MLHWYGQLLHIHRISRNTVSRQHGKPYITRYSTTTTPHTPQSTLYTRHTEHTPHTPHRAHSTHATQSTVHTRLASPPHVNCAPYSNTTQCIPHIRTLHHIPTPQYTTSNHMPHNIHHMAYTIISIINHTPHKIHHHHNTQHTPHSIHHHHTTRHTTCTT